MKRVNAFLNHVRIAATSKLFIVSALVVLSGGLVAVNTLTNPGAAWADLPRDCDDNSVVYCGTTTKDEFVAKYNENKTGDLPAVYAQFGLSQDELSRFNGTAKMGTVYKDGRVVVDGKVVAHDAKSIGRHDMAGSAPMQIAGKTFYLRPTGVSFRGDSIEALVMMNGNKVEFVALTSCGNPVTMTQPSYSCDMLTSQKVDDDTYKFSSKVTAKDGATLTKVVYEFGDGQKVEKTNPGEVVTHDYAKPGKYTAKVTAYFTYQGQQLTHTSADCTKNIEVPQPPKPQYACSALTARKISRTKYEFVATTKTAGGATPKDASVDFGDNQKVEGVKAKDGKFTVEHEYAKEGDYTIVATVNFNIADGVKSAKCEAKLTVDKDTPEECKPGIPVGDERCEEKPEVPAELPSTGPIEIIGSTIGLGSIAAAGNYYLRTRRDLLSTIFKK